MANYSLVNFIAINFIFYEWEISPTLSHTNKKANASHESVEAKVHQMNEKLTAVSDYQVTELQIPKKTPLILVLSFSH